jgi:predicted molibdopterin-dependent oxidoreductase YjgC
MPNDALFQPLYSADAVTSELVCITFNGELLQVPMASSVAAALIGAGVKQFRNSPVSGNGRAPYCMMGVCFECLLEIDGIPNRQSCLVPLKAGMHINKQDYMGHLLSKEAFNGL